MDFPQGVHAKRFMLARDVLDAEALVSVCKMKTHALEHITGAVKNQYGCVQGFHKAKGHTLYSDPVSFARMLGDLNRLVKPRLYIMDGITAMEGNGPTSGDPVPMHLLLLSTDPVALDSVFCHLFIWIPAGAHQCAGGADGPGYLAAGKHRAADGGGPHGAFPGVGAVWKPGFSRQAQPGKSPGLDGRCGDF